MDASIRAPEVHAKMYVGQWGDLLSTRTTDKVPQIKIDDKKYSCVINFVRHEDSARGGEHCSCTHTGELSGDEAS